MWEFVIAICMSEGWFNVTIIIITNTTTTNNNDNGLLPVGELLVLIGSIKM